MNLLLCLLCFLAVPLFASPELRPGVYKLKGSNPLKPNQKYEGKIVIARERSNYRVTWLIGQEINQAQVGIGILESGVLSIGYLDTSGADFGVVSMKVIDGKRLKGKWSSIFSDGTSGEEEFEFETENVPEKWKATPPKKKDKKEFI